MSYTVAGEIVIYKDGKRVMSLDCPKKKPIPISGDDITALFKWANSPIEKGEEDAN